MISHSYIIISLLYIIETASSPLNFTHPKLKIAGGEPADIKDFPYQVALRLGDAICGGAILNERYILTAAHCTYDVETWQISVRAGSNYTDAGGVEIPAEVVVQHPSFDPDTYDYDIALVKLQKNLSFSDTISPIDLVPAGFTIEDNRLATVSGYGWLSDKGPLAPSLQKVELPLISTESCQKIYGTEYITGRMFCAGYAIGGKDACPGDSGGAIVLSGQVLGIVSFGPDCAHPNLPGGYTKISEFIDFVDSIIKN